MIAAADICLSDPVFWFEHDRDDVFELLRQEQPVSWQREPESAFGPAGPGYWAITRHADVYAVSRDSKTFRNCLGILTSDLDLEIARDFDSILVYDDPEHAELRRLVNKVFSPKMLRPIAKRVRERAHQVVERVAGMRQCDFIAEIAAPLPLHTTCDMLGVPESDRDELKRLIRIVHGLGDPDVATLDAAHQATLQIIDYAVALGRKRASEPRDDLTTALATADVQGTGLGEREFGRFWHLLLAGGLETTANAIGHGMLALTQHPHERARWQANFDVIAPTAIEEILRWSTPILHFRRTAMRDARLDGQMIAEGDKVVLWYYSANRDGAVFREPRRFDVTRNPNPHFSFGAGGAHYCLGATLARIEVGAMFEALFRYLPDIEATGDPVLLKSNFVHRIDSLTCSFSSGI